jgi:hypothetical protein
MATPAELFDEIAKAMFGYCDAPDVVIRVEMQFASNPIEVSVVRHIRDPNDIFDNSRDVALALPENQMTAVAAKVQKYFDISKGWEDRLLRTTLSVYQDGEWSVSSASEKK